jgi:signal transduction histidine kinase
MDDRSANLRENHASSTEAALRELATLLGRIRHLTNTPLQTIATATDLLKLQHQESGESFERIERAIERLRYVSRLLAVHEMHLRWSQDDQAPTTTRDTQAIEPTDAL